MKKDPERDCRKYNVKARAMEIFTALDLDKNGFVDEDEFIAGNLYYDKLLTSFKQLNFRLHVG